MASNGLKGLAGAGAKKPGKGLNLKHNSKNQLDKHGLPIPAPKVFGNFFKGLDDIPIDPTDASAVRELRIAKVEVCLLKGITSPTRISHLVGCKFETARSDIETVELRWATTSSKTRLKQVRGQAIKRLDRIIEMLEDMAQNGANDVVRTQALKYLMDANAQRMLLDNITPKTIEMLDMEEVDEKGLAHVEQRKAEHAHNQHLAAALQAYLASKGALPSPDAVDVEYVEVQRTPPEE